MASREGSLEAPTRHPLDWNNPDFFNEDLLMQELERVYDICHGCRRCFNLCNAFPTLFDAVDDSPTMEVDGVEKRVFWKVVDHCYLCDMCYMTKCPYVPPHEWNVDFPHLMLRAKAVKHHQGKTGTRDKILSATDIVGKIAGVPVVSTIVNAVNQNKVGRKVVEELLEVHPDAHLPKYHSKSLRSRLGVTRNQDATAAPAAGPTKGKVALFATCYANHNEPELGEDLVAIFEHNDLPVRLLATERCCGMPKLELGDLNAVQKAKEVNIPQMIAVIDEGWDIVAPVPSCVLMFKQELPLMFPDDEDVLRVRDHIYDPFEYLMLRHKHDALKTDFKNSLGKISYHVACHLRVQNIGLKTRDLLQLIPDTEVDPIERCSGHDGTYAVKKEFHEVSMKICKPVVNRVKKAQADHYSSDCPMAGHQIANGMEGASAPEHPLKLLRLAYGI